MTVSQRLGELGISLPEVAKPLAAYVPATVVGNQVWTSGQLPVVAGTPIHTGKLGGDVSLEQGVECARTCLLNALAAIAQAAGGVDRITRILKVVVFVASVPEFTDQPKVGNGASELVGEIFGEAGSHVRSAVGVSVLPLDTPVEIEVIAEIG
ncbi:RidA family protein [Granulicoccus sp. GXG6511]|uniref:RidA family protein n=1 Tax=Granulicoccus sp. GXG6511 TaxID=3381351 RepID=UPI003D7D4F56